MRSYWWANQSDNFERVEGTLWTNFYNAGGSKRPGSSALATTRPGDIVFHCDKQLIRTVSRVTSEPAVRARPAEYMERQSGSEKDEGWYVKVEPVKSGLTIDRRTDLSSIELGGTGPLNKLGGLKRGVYLSPLSEDSAKALLALANIDIAKLSQHGPTNF